MDAYLFLAAWLGVVLVWLTAIVDGARRPAAHWSMTGRPKALWVTALVGLGVVGGLYYWVVVRRELNAAKTRATPG